MKWVSHSELIVEKKISKEILNTNKNESISLVESVSLFNYKINLTNRLFCYNKISYKDKKTLLYLLDNSTTIDEIKKIIKINKLKT